MIYYNFVNINMDCDILLAGCLVDLYRSKLKFYNMMYCLLGLRLSDMLGCQCQIHNNIGS